MPAATQISLTAVFKRLAHLLLIVALVTATGTHWVILQSVAWTSMLAQNLQEAPVSDALVKTFDGKHPCNICKAITHGKQSEKKSEFPAPVKKWDFVSEHVTFVFSSPREFWLVPERDLIFRDLAHSPLRLPPRAFSA
jgi:hypothetical protein